MMGRITRSSYIENVAVFGRYKQIVAAPNYQLISCWLPSTSQNVPTISNILFVAIRTSVRSATPHANLWPTRFIVRKLIIMMIIRNVQQQSISSNNLPDDKQIPEEKLYKMFFFIYFLTKQTFNMSPAVMIIRYRNIVPTVYIFYKWWSMFHP